MFRHQRSLRVCGTIAFALFASAAEATTSTFSVDTEGWVGQGDTQGPLTWSGSGGNPGGHVFIDDLTTGGVTYFVAPPKFLCNQSGALGSFLTFDLRQVFSGNKESITHIRRIGLLMMRESGIPETVDIDE